MQRKTELCLPHSVYCFWFGPWLEKFSPSCYLAEHFIEHGHSYAIILSYPILSPPFRKLWFPIDLKTEHLWLKDNKIKKLVSINCWNPDLVWLYLTLKKERKNPTDKHSSAFLSPKMRMKKTQTAGKLHWGRSSWSSSHGKARYLFKDRTEFQQTQGNVKILHKQEEERIQLSLQPVHNE